MKESAFCKIILENIDRLQKEYGDTFLELLVDTIILKDIHDREIGIMYGFDYNLARSRHWDKEQKNYIFYDGFNERHLFRLFNDIQKRNPAPARITLLLDGMNDLDEAIHGQIDLELDNFHG